MNRVILSKSAKKKIEKIFSHPGEIFSVYRTDSEEVAWLNGKIELYNYLRTLGK